MKAIVYNKYMQGLGGGERSTLAYARALLELGYETSIVSDQELPSASQIERSFGSEFAGLQFGKVDPGRVSEHVRGENAEIFVNHSLGSLDPNPAPIGIYSMMFPVRRVNIHNNPQGVRSLNSYHLLLNNSSFTKRYTDIFWDFPESKSKVLHPPIGAKMTERARQCAIDPPAKEQLFLGIGRFAVYPANKNQKLLIESFLEARSRDRTLRDWRLVLVGNRNPDEASEQYCRECLKLAVGSGGAVEIHHDLPQPELIGLLERAFGYVHAAGAFLPPGSNPHQCEHFGLSIVEGLSYGCLPLLYARGGVFDILDVERAGFPYATPEGLVAGFSVLAALYRSPAHRAQQKDLGRMAACLSFERFTEGLRDAIDQIKSKF